MPIKPILVVEDNPDIRVHLRLVLEEERFTVLESSNGQEALNLLRSKEGPALQRGIYYKKLVLPGV